MQSVLHVTVWDAQSDGDSVTHIYAVGDESPEYHRKVAAHVMAMITTHSEWEVSWQPTDRYVGEVWSVCDEDGWRMHYVAFRTYEPIVIA